MRRTAVMVLAALVGAAAWALDPPKTAPPPPVKPPEAQPAAEPAPVPAAEAPAVKDAEAKPAAAGEPQDEESLPPLPPGSRSTGPTPQRFDPSEEVRADFPVSFPVDI